TGDQVGRQLRRILEVAVHDDDGVARRAVETGRDRHLVAEVPREADHLEARVAAAQVREQIGATVRAAVVDEDPLGGAVAAALYLPAVARAGFSVKLKPAASTSVAQGRSFTFSASVSSDVALTDEVTFAIMPVGQPSKAVPFDRQLAAVPPGGSLDVDGNVT